MHKTKIKVLLIESMKQPEICYVKPTMKAFRSIVKADVLEHGDIEAKKLETKVYAIFNKDRFLVDLMPNRRIGEDIIVGTMMIVAIDDNRIPVSLSNKQISKYALRFWNTETFDDMDVIEANLNLMFSRLLIDE